MTPHRNHSSREHLQEYRVFRQFFLAGKRLSSISLTIYMPTAATDGSQTER